jgi:enoyl-CoA hydratase
MAVLPSYNHLQIERHGHVSKVILNRPESLNAANHVLHDELGRVWVDLGADEQTRAVVVTGAGKAFSAGGDLNMVDSISRDYQAVAESLEQTSRIVYNMLSLDKPVVSAINGTAVGAGLTIALLADISIVADDVRLSDGHARLGVVAGDHSAIVWPILCGMAKAKLYLLTADFITGPEAERIGLVSLCVPQERLLDTAMDYARRLAAGPQHAVRWTKRSLNNWLRSAGPMFDASLAFEHLTLLGPDVREGIRAIREKRVPDFDHGSGSEAS